MQAPDWSRADDYLWMDTLTPREWAWEFLRRNPDFQAAWQIAKLEFGIAGYCAQTAMLVSQHQVPRLSAWGCIYCSDPARDAREAQVIWTPEINPHVLRLSAFSVAEKVEATPFSLREIVSPSILLEMPTGPQHLLFTDGGRRLQLLIHGADVTRPVRLVTDGAPDRVLAKPQLRSLQCFNDMRLAGKLHSSHVQRDPISTRWRRVLRTLDGSLAGAPRKEIARYVLPEYSDARWLLPERPLQDRIRRTIHRGHALMREGYRKLLS